MNLIMIRKLVGLILAVLWSFYIIAAPKKETFEVKSPNEQVVLKIDLGQKLQWSLNHKGQQIINPSSISLELEEGEGYQLSKGHCEGSI
jgi:hypothetical protein